MQIALAMLALAGGVCQTRGRRAHSSRSFNGATFVRPPPTTRWKDAGTCGRLPSATPPLASSARHKWHGRPRCAHIFLRALRAAESTGFGWRSDTVEHGDVVKIHYTGFLEDGSEFETTGGKDPLEFQVGAGRVVPGIEAAVVGMALGERRSATVACEDAFGYGLQNRVVNISIFEFPEPVQVGDRIGVKGLFAVVKSVQDAWVEVDANHPLCGEDLYLDVQLVELTKRSTLEVATFAGGSFWALELAFQRVDGVVSTQVGYTQGRKDNPTYAEVCSGRTGHVEAVRAYFDPQKVTYLDLLEVFFSTVDVTQLNRQGLYEGTQYRSGLYYHTETQRLQAQEALLLVQEQLTQRPLVDWHASQATEVPVFKENCTVVTELLPNATFWTAEPKHQQYLEKLGFSSEKGDPEPINTKFKLDDEMVGAADFWEDEDDDPTL